ncbi:MAG: hypothetical protein ACLVBP_09555 [Ruminococcus sp.]
MRAKYTAKWGVLQTHSGA